MLPGPGRDPTHATTLHWQGLRAGAALFDQGRFWDAHEVWEEVWRAYHGPDRHYLKGLIQLAAINYHIARGVPRAARRLVESSAHHLAVCDPMAWPFDTGHLLAALAALGLAIDNGRPVRPFAVRLGAMLDHWSAREQRDEFV